MLVHAVRGWSIRRFPEEASEGLRNMNVLILCDHYPLSPRVKKLRASLEKLYDGCTVRVLAWNRNLEGGVVREDYVYSFDQLLGYGNKMAKIMNLPRFARAAKTVIRDFRPQYIHAIDLEMLIVAVLMGYRAKVIYEVYDIKASNNRFVNLLREKIETILIHKHVHKVVLASPFFTEYYRGLGVDDSIMTVLNNKPTKEILSKGNSGFMDKYKSSMEHKRVIGFIGTIRYPNILLTLITAVQDLDDFVVLLAGDGPSLARIRHEIEGRKIKDKVIITGAFSQDDLPCIYKVCDYVWAAYPPDDLNVKYAVSNKFFEAQLFGKPVLVSRCTRLGDYVEDSHAGVTVDPYSMEDIKKVLVSLSVRDNVTCGDFSFWEDEDVRLLDVYT